MPEYFAVGIGVECVDDAGLLADDEGPFAGGEMDEDGGLAEVEIGTAVVAANDEDVPGSELAGPEDLAGFPAEGHDGV